MPVLPAVLSTTSPPGLISPRFSASRIIWRAGRSFTDWPGFINSALPRMVQPVASDACLSLINGVLPMAATIPSRIDMSAHPGGGRRPTLDDGFRRDKLAAIRHSGAERSEELGIHKSQPWIPGSRHPSRLLPTWATILPISGKPEIGGAPRNDGVLYCRCCSAFCTIGAGVL